jgi:DNA-binding MarR family transcriptional regulator/GNAT superfamily N-acetyltransferase
MRAEQIATVRSFNRITMERVGALSEEFLDRSRPLGQSRLLWEIGAGGADVRDLRARLGLDSGYLTRTLQALEREGLVRVDGGRADRRVRRASLTAKGLQEWRELDRRSDTLAASVLEPLGDRQRDELAGAMRTVERLLTASIIRIGVEGPRSVDARWCLEQYFLELNERFDVGFDPARSISADAEELMPPAGALLVARLRGAAVGCGALKLHGGVPAEIKRMWVSPEARGLGLGRRLLHELEEHARRAGARVARLETNRSLTEAISLYRRSGYEEVDAFNDEPYAHHWFEKRL